MMNKKIVGSVVRWAAVIIGAIGAFASDPSFMGALTNLSQSIANGDIGTIIGGAVALLTLGWSIWDKIRTTRKETEMESEIKTMKMMAVPSAVIKDEESA